MKFSVLVILSLVQIACGDNATAVTDGGNDGAPVDAAPETDAPPPCPAPQPNSIGGICQTTDMGDTCTDVDAFCLTGSAGSGIVWPSQGYCTKFSCTTDADCGTDGLCAEIMDDGFSYTACFAKGCDDGRCSADQVRTMNLYGLAPSDKAICVPGSETAVDGDSCENFGDCAANSTCFKDALDFPGGYCRTNNCNVGDNTSCAPTGDGVCVESFPAAAGLDVCMAGCVTNADCRENLGYQCVTDGSQSYCDHPRAGNACTVNDDCGPTPNASWECLTTNFPGGYCSIGVGTCNIANNTGCPIPTSVCHDPDGGGAAEQYCAQRCATAGEISAGEGDRFAPCRSGYTCEQITSAGNEVGVCVPNP